MLYYAIQNINYIIIVVVYTPNAVWACTERFARDVQMGARAMYTRARQSEREMLLPTWTGLNNLSFACKLLL